MKNLYIENILGLEEGSFVRLFAWVQSIRSHGSIIFFEVIDSTGNIQVVFSKENFASIELREIEKINIESAVYIEGKLTLTKKSQLEILASSIDVIADAETFVSPNPRNANLDPFDPRLSEMLSKHPTFYIRNPKLAAVHRFKARFRHELAVYLYKEGFTLFEPPNLTSQTFYDDNDALWVDFNGQMLSLSRCATFHLEPAIMIHEKVFSITESHANEKSRSNRHLAEFTHLKAECAWANLDDLITLAGRLFYQVSKNTFRLCRKEIKTLGIENKIHLRINLIKPSNYKVTTYDEAVCLLRKNNISFKYGKNFSSGEEKILTDHYGGKFVWIKYKPCSCEAFPFKKVKGRSNLTQTSDLVAPFGFGEILGAAEKNDNYNELIERMSEKGKNQPSQIERYRDYLELRKQGLPPHGGIGMGIERAIRFLLDLQHVKFTRPFPVVYGTRVHH